MGAILFYVAEPNNVFTKAAISFSKSEKNSAPGLSKFRDCINLYKKDNITL